MASELHKIQAKIEALEEQMENYMPVRKDEIFEILKSNNGIMIDDRLLAGFVIYANSRDNKSSSFLKELYDLGKGKIPSKRSAQKSNKKSDITNKVSGDTKEKKEANG